MQAAKQGLSVQKGRVHVQNQILAFGLELQTYLLTIFSKKRHLWSLL